MKDQKNPKVTLVYAQGPLSKEFLSKISGLEEDKVVTIKWVTGHPKCNMLKSYRKEITISRLCEELEKYFEAQVPEQYALIGVCSCTMTYIASLVPDKIYMFDKKTNRFRVAGYLAIPVLWNDIGDTYPPAENVPYLDDMNELLESILNIYSEEPSVLRALFNVLHYSPIIFATREDVHVCGQWNHGQAMNGKTVMYL